MIKNPRKEFKVVKWIVLESHYYKPTELSIHILSNAYYIRVILIIEPEGQMLPPLMHGNCRNSPYGSAKVGLPIYAGIWWSARNAENECFLAYDVFAKKRSANYGFKKINSTSYLGNCNTVKYVV